MNSDIYISMYLSYYSYWYSTCPIFGYNLSQGQIVLIWPLCCFGMAPESLKASLLYGMTRLKNWEYRLRSLISNIINAIIYFYCPLTYPLIYTYIINNGVNTENRLKFKTFFLPALLRYNWHTALCKFKVHSIMIWLTHIMRWLSQ